MTAVDKEIANWPPEKYLPTSSAFLEAKQQAKGVKSYNAQQIAEHVFDVLVAPSLRLLGHVRVPPCNPCRSSGRP